MALYAFDGTGNEDHKDDSLDTNVRKFFEAHLNINSTDCYLRGVGTDNNRLDMILGGMTGAGGHERVDEAMERLAGIFRAGDETIDIIGFSRGAAPALDFANAIYNEGAPAIRFLGLWDTVASFGWPGNGINIGFELTLPRNVEICRHAMSLDERRFMFPLTRVTQDKFSRADLKDVEEVWFRGYHSDVGGGNENDGLSNIALYWMYCQAEAAGLVFEPADVHAARISQDRSASPKTPGMDRFPNGKRTIRASDRVHTSVSRIAMAGRFEANNPPKGLAVAGDVPAALMPAFEAA